MKLDLQTVLRGAEAIYLQLACCKELPVKVQEVIGLWVPTSSEETSPESESHETQHLLSQSHTAATTTGQSNNGNSTAARPPVTHP
ncbi:hypothetical protein DPEC_G00304950 [Dallia pectoralis]|uniref:Uncharacterized protein n=1 Tax=Dallia pectoralis TaxID=75939 RepID=A0ACC2FDV7_DALPE|nr:hypothetical protein DPEC_G00304950 [Dallia pectoralis]